MDILSLHIENYLSFKLCDADWSGRDGIFLITGRNGEESDDSESNGSGKSAFISAGIWCKFGRSRGVFDKDLNNEDVIHIDAEGQRAKRCLVREVFVHSGAFYRVERSVNDKGAQTLEVSSSTDAVEWHDLTLKAGMNKRTGKKESGIFRTQQRINDILGCDVDLFVNSAYFEQSNIDTFARGTLGDKDKLIKAAVGSDRWGDYGLMISKDIAEVEREVAKVEALIEDNYTVEDIKGQIIQADKEAIEVKAKQADVAGVVETRQKEVDKLRLELSKVQESRVRRQTLKTDIETAQGKKTTKDAALSMTQRDIANVSKDIEAANTSRSAFDEAAAVARARADEIRKTLDTGLTAEVGKMLSDEVNQVNVEIGRAEARKDDIVTRGKAVDTMACPYGLECGQITGPAKEEMRSKLRAEYKEVAAEAKRLLGVRSEKETLIEGVKLNLQRAYDWAVVNHEAEKADASSQATKDRITASEQRLTDLAGREKELKKEVKEWAAEVVKLTKQLQALGTDTVDSDDLVGRHDEAVVQHDEAKAEQTRLSEQYLELTARVRKLRDDLKKISELQERKDAILNEMGFKKYALQMMRRDIPHLLIANSIPEIVESARGFIYKMSGGRMDLDFRMVKDLKTKATNGEAAQANAFDIILTIDGKELKYEQTSGGQRARADVAIHLAYIVFISNRAQSKIETLWLDEVGAALDKSGVERFVDIVKEIQTTYGFKKVFIVTQNVEMRRMIDNRIVVVLTADGSQIVAE